MKDATKMWMMFAAGFLFIGLAIFLPAGTIYYWQAWVFLGASGGLSILLTLYVVKDPVLLAGRAKAVINAEQRPLQKVIVWFITMLALAAFVVPGLDRRFGWSDVPPWLSIAGDVLIVVSMWMVYRVFKENSFGAATVEIARGQKVISTGPYAIVRNPMYSGAIVYFFAMSIALGSYAGMVPAALMIFGFTWRLFDEERFLAENLEGYTEYCAKVRWHLVPGIF